MNDRQAADLCAAPVLDLQQFEDYQQIRLAKSTLALYWRIVRQPGGREKINAKIEEMRREAAASEERKEQCT